MSVQDRLNKKCEESCGESGKACSILKLLEALEDGRITVQEPNKMKEEEMQIVGLDLGSVSWKLIQFRSEIRIRDAFYYSRFMSTFLGWWEIMLFDRAKNCPRIYSYICRSTFLLASLERELFIGELHLFRLLST